MSFLAEESMARFLTSGFLADVLIMSAICLSVRDLKMIDIMLVFTSSSYFTLMRWILLLVPGV